MSEKLLGKKIMKSNFEMFGAKKKLDVAHRLTYSLQGLVRSTVSIFSLYKKMHITNYLQNLILQICPDFYKKKLMKHFWWNLKPLSMSLVCTVG